LITGFASVGVALGVVFAANSIFIPEIEFGSGVAALPECVREAFVDFDLQVFTTGTTIRALDVRGLAADCNGQHLRITLTGVTDDVIRQLPSNQLSTNTTLRITVPAPAIDPATVFGITMETSDQPF
jgi:hypothetical protein